MKRGRSSDEEGGGYRGLWSNIGVLRPVQGERAQERETDRQDVDASGWGPKERQRRGRKHGEAEGRDSRAERGKRPFEVCRGAGDRGHTNSAQGYILLRARAQGAMRAGESQLPGSDALGSGVESRGVPALRDPDEPRPCKSWRPLA